MFDWTKSDRKTGTGKASNKASIDTLFRTHRASLLRFATSKLKDADEADEVVQEAFIRFEKNYDVDAIASPEALLARIVSNLVIDRVRGKNARVAREEAWGKLHTVGADESLSDKQSVDPARVLDAKQQVEAVLRILDTLPEKTRKIFLLHRLEGLSHAEVSERTGIPRSTVEKHMIRGIRAIATLKDE
ncbi:MAG: RNA polymerase sigma factor [Alphaproteobacteria bacterium]|nr:MAG: RNA polymerase sigma factor [Alphaproteobacteria bacterium]